MPYQMPYPRMKRRSVRVRRVKPLRKVSVYGWVGVSKSFGRVWGCGRRKPKSDRRWRIQFKGYLRESAYVGWDCERQRFMVGDGTPCVGPGRLQMRIGWREALYS